jgi:hypothetical protein
LRDRLGSRGSSSDLGWGLLRRLFDLCGSGWLGLSGRRGRRFLWFGWLRRDCNRFGWLRFGCFFDDLAVRQYREGQPDRVFHGLSKRRPVLFLSSPKRETGSASFARHLFAGLFGRRWPGFERWRGLGGRLGFDGDPGLRLRRRLQLCGRLGFNDGCRFGRQLHLGRGLGGVLCRRLRDRFLGRFGHRVGRDFGA